MHTGKSSSPLPSLGLLQKLFDSLQEIVCALDADGRFVYINKACYRLWGYQPEELMGVSCFDLMVEEDRNASFKATREAYDGANIPTFENRYYRKDDSIVTMFWEGGWDFDNQLLYSTGRDISEKKRVEQLEQQYQEELQQTKQQLENLLERITDGFIGLDEQARVTYWNKAAEVISKIPHQEVVGKVLWDVIPEPGRSYYLQEYQKVKAANKPLSVELFSKRLERWVEVNTYISGSGLSIFFRDVTEQKELREQLLNEKEQQQKRITAAVIKATEQERAHVGKELHDNVNRVLTTVKLYIELCLSDTGNTKELLTKSSQLLQESINEIRGLSKRLSAPTLGTIRLRDSIAELVASINATNRLQVQYKQTIDDLEVSQELHIAVYRILQEHLTNVLNHAAAEQASIQLYTAEAELVINVWDNGKGFDTSKRSTGIGIANMITRAESLSGTLTLDSAPGYGTRLEARFPLKQY